eukprot:PhF_6_TR2503/c0_g1_i1/m.4277
MSHVLLAAITLFKRLNGLNDFDNTRATSCVFRALQVSLRSIENRETLQGLDLRLIGKYGVLTDTAQLTFPEESEALYESFQVDGNGMRKSTDSTSNTRTLFVLKGKPRYAITGAQIVMLRLGFGMFSQYLGW